MGACEGMCKWCRAMNTYYNVAKVVRPKQAALKKAKEKLEVVQAALAVTRAELKEVEDKLASLQKGFDDANNEKVALANKVESCKVQLVRANKLLDGLGGEKGRWIDARNRLGLEFTNLTGDVLMCSGMIAYLGPFTSVFRHAINEQWQAAVTEEKIPTSPKVGLQACLGDPVIVRQWNIDGLPRDDFSVDNGIMMYQSSQIPLCIDPQGQANKWVRNREANKQLKIAKLSEDDFARSLESCIQFGKPLLLENVMEQLDPLLDPLLQKQFVKAGASTTIRVGDQQVQYDPTFCLVITTKLRNPHYMPEVCVKVNLINFMITPEGLQDQMLNIAVEKEQPVMAEEKQKLIRDSAANAKTLQEIEDVILKYLAEATGNILEDESLIETLDKSKKTSNEIKKAQAASEVAEKRIDAMREKYQRLAFRCQLLYFAVADMALVDPMYQNSLDWFIKMLLKAVNKDGGGADEPGEEITKPDERIEVRIDNIIDFFTYSIYKNMCRSVFVKDKLLFSLVLCTRILEGAGELDSGELRFLLTGGTSLELTKLPNPSEKDGSWLGSKGWNEIVNLDTQQPAFAGFRESFSASVQEWRKVYDSNTPHEEMYPGKWNDAITFHKLMILRCIRPDKVVPMTVAFLTEKMGRRYVDPPPFNLQDCYNDSSCDQ